MSFAQETFDAEFTDPNTADLFTTNGGPFAPDFTQFGGIRTLAANNELETYVDPAFDNGLYNPFSIENGVLTISAVPTPSSMTDLVSTPYVSGMLETPNFAQQYRLL